MKSVSIGIRAALPSKGTEGDERRGGFTLIEALVALSVVLAFAAALGPFMFQSRRILVQGDGQVRAELLLRTLLATPFERAKPELGVREGESSGLRWRLDVEPTGGEASDSDAPPPDSKKKDARAWALFRVKAHVGWGDGQMVTAETLRLGEIK
jgi:prepilin-type N-terminal cleavage/methylation domain-containing protein